MSNLNEKDKDKKVKPGKRGEHGTVHNEPSKVEKKTEKKQE